MEELYKVSRRQSKRILSGTSRVVNPHKRGRPQKYQDRKFKDSLRYFWKVTGFMCSRALKVAIPLWLPYIEATERQFVDDIKERLLKISASSIDRLLKPHRTIKGKSFTRGGGFREEIPIQTNIWNITQPGFIEADTVAHCGGSMAGEFVNSVTIVDIATLWTEVRAIFGRGSTKVVESLEDIEARLPFVILGYDSDNGT